MKAKNLLMYSCAQKMSDIKKPNRDEFAFGGLKCFGFEYM